MRVPFFKLSGGGNDFLALVEPEDPPSDRDVRLWCRRGLSAGADGLIALSRTADGMTMDYWNSDGGPANLCLNALRCAGQLAFHLRWAEREIPIRCGAGVLSAHRLDDGSVAVEAPPPSEGPRHVHLVTTEGTFDASFVRVGVPHVVCAVEGGLDELAVDSLGALLRSHPDLGTVGANVDFVLYADPHLMAIRSFERGIEGETLACGTGILAAVAAGLAGKHLELPVTALPRGGFELRVSGEASGATIRCWTLAGDARLVAEGVLLPGAGVDPPGTSLC